MKVGVVKTLIGNVYAINSEGVQRKLNMGDDIYWFDVLSTTFASGIEVSLLDDSEVTLGRNTQIVLTEAFFDSAIASKENSIRTGSVN